MTKMNQKQLVKTITLKIELQVPNQESSFSLLY